MTRYLSTLMLVLMLFPAAYERAFAAQMADVGSVSFPTSGNAQAQEHFERGVGILHSFGWKQAIAEFQAAQELDPDFAMAYWGESLCYNHPLQRERDLDTPRAVLNKLGPDLAARLAKAPTEREKGFVTAVDALFFGDGDYGERRIAYMKSMRNLYESFPDDDEVATFYALSLLTAAGPSGARATELNVLGGAIGLEVTARNPMHPGAVHYTIHGFDDPIHARLALPAARVFADIAGAVSHAQHMPTHIFIQLGMWDEVSSSNQAAYDVAVDLWEPGDVPGDMVHALDWGQYGDLQRGDYARANQWIERMVGISERNAEHHARLHGALPRVRARLVLESQQWKTLPVTDKASAVELLATGLSAIELGDLKLAAKASRRLQELAVEAAKDNDRIQFARTTQPLQIMHKEVAGSLALAKGRTRAGLKLLREGVAIAESMRAPNGAPNPIKPVHEVYAEALLETGDLTEARAQFEKSLQRTPNRTLSLLGLARTLVAAGDELAARAQYEKLAEISAGRQFPASQEASEYLSGMGAD